MSSGTEGGGGGWDFSGEDPGPSPPKPATKPYDPQRARESMRGVLAGGLTALFAVTTLGLIVCLAAGKLTAGEVKELATDILAPITTLTATAIGFYFGGRDNGARK